MSSKGVYFFNRMKLVGAWKTEMKPENEWGKAECPPIISEELWNQANQIMEEQLKAWKKPGKAPVHLFSGLAHCACGNRMYVNSRTPKYFCRKCNNKIPILDLENIMREELKGFFSQPERIGKHLKEADRNLIEKSALLGAHKGEIQKIKDEIAKTHKLYLADQLSVEGFGAIAKPLEERLGQLNLELPRLEAEVDFLRVNKLSADDVMHEANTMYEQWPALAPEDKRKVMEALVEKVTIGNGEIDITFSCVPSSEDVCKSQQRLGTG